MAVDPNRFAGPAEAVILREHIENESSDLLRVRSRLQKARTALSDAELALRAAQEAADSARFVVAQGEAHEFDLTESIDRARGLLHPVRRVPDEILAEIFLQWLDAHSDAHPEPSLWNYRPLQLVPFTAARICRRWRAVALNTPLLWTRIVLDFRKVDQNPSSWYIFMTSLSRRSGSSRLSLWVTVSNDTIEDDDKHYSHIWRQLILTCRRCGFLSVHCRNIQHRRLKELICGSAPLLDGFTFINDDWELAEDFSPFSIFENLPRLRDLRLVDVEISWDEGRPFEKTKKLHLSRIVHSRLSLAELAQVATKLPNLEDLSLHCRTITSSAAPDVRFSRVKILEFVGDIDAAAAQCLRFPLLREVLLARTMKHPATIIGLSLSHSTNLSKLTLRRAIAESSLAEAVALLKSLADLTLTICTIRDDFFRGLAAQSQNGSMSCPLLARLHLTDILPSYNSRDIFDGTSLLAFIRGRRSSATTSGGMTTLRDVKITWAEDDQSFEGFQDELQQLVM